jgi:hypothetical protein
MDDVAPPADLSRVVELAPATRYWRVGRIVAYASVLVAVAGVTVVLLTRDPSSEPVVASSTTTAGVTETTGDATTSTSAPPTTGASVSLVPAVEWPSPALDPTLALPDCGPTDVVDFIYEEFPDLGGLDTTTVPVAEVTDVVPLPRIGADSVFPSDLAGWCLAVRRIEDVTAWKLQGPQPEQYVFAATRPRESNRVPEEVLDEYYHQSHIASGHGFNVSVRPGGRAVGVLDHADFVLAGGEWLWPEGDVYLWGERLAMSLYKAPIQAVWGGSFASSLFDPSGMPAGFGPCMVESLVWEQSGEGAEWARMGFCDPAGRYIDVLYGFGGDYPPIPGDAAEEWGTGLLRGWSWVEEDRRNIIFDLDDSSQMAVWLSGPESVGEEILDGVTRSMLVFHPAITSPRTGQADFVDDADIQRRFDDAAALAPVGVAPVLLAHWPDDGGGILDEALAIGAGRFEALQAVDVAVADRGDFVQAIFSCGGQWFNVSLQPASPSSHDPMWSGNHYEEIVDWLGQLEIALGCSVSGGTFGSSAEVIVEGTREPYTFEETQSYGEFGPVLWHLVTTINGTKAVDHHPQYEWVEWGLLWAGHQPDDGPHVVYGVTNLSAVDVEAVEGILPVGTTIVLREVRWSLDQLEDWKEMLNDGAPENGVCSTGFGLEPNKIRVTASTPDPDLGPVPEDAVWIDGVTADGCEATFLPGGGSPEDEG